MINSSFRLKYGCNVSSEDWCGHPLSVNWYTLNSIGSLQVWLGALTAIVSPGKGTDSGISEEGRQRTGNASALALVFPALYAILDSYAANVRVHR